MELTQRVLQRLDECGHSLTEPVLLAVSGGADSIALLRLMCSLVESPKKLCTVAHLNHLLRGASSHADERFVSETARGLGCRFVTEQVEIPVVAANEKRGLEETARRVRYEFLERIAVAHQIPVILLAHTADDQAETVLHHILRGSGIRGLSGIPLVRTLESGVRLVRPLLDVSRSEIESWLGTLQQDYRVDETNFDPTYTRNRLRHELLPLLEQHYNSQVKAALTRLSAQAEALQSMMNSLAETALQQALISRSETECLLNRKTLAMHPRPVVRECFVQLWVQQEWPRQRMSFAHWEQLASLVQGGAAIMLPGAIRAECQRDHLWISR